MKYKLKSGKYIDKDGNRFGPGDVVEFDRLPLAFADLFVPYVPPAPVVDAAEEAAAKAEAEKKVAEEAAAKAEAEKKAAEEEAAKAKAAGQPAAPVKK